MSGLEVLGAIAGAAQLATYVVQAAAFLTEIYERLKHAPERISQHAHQIARLVDVVLYIKDNELIYTKLVFAQLEHTIKEASNLRDLLIKVLGQYTQPSIRKKYWKLLQGKNEAQILCALENLEREKTGLTLCLTAAQTELLYEVQREVRRVETDTPYRMSETTTVTGTMPLADAEVLLPLASQAQLQPDQRQLGQAATSKVDLCPESRSKLQHAVESQAHCNQSPHQQSANRDVNGPEVTSDPAGNTNARTIRKIVIGAITSTLEASQENDFTNSANNLELNIGNLSSTGKNTRQVNKW